MLATQEPQRHAACGPTGRRDYRWVGRREIGSEIGFILAGLRGLLLLNQLDIR
jgi:hypothetical protein